MSDKVYGRYDELTASKGIYLGNTTNAAANVLDWYEEGTWTPVFTPYSGAFAAITYLAQSGSFTRIGRIVIVSFEMALSAFSIGTASTLLTVTGLPYSASTDGNKTLQGSVTFVDGFLNNNPTFISKHSGTSIALTYAASLVRTNLPPQNLQSSSQLRGTIIYYV